MKVAILKSSGSDSVGRLRVTDPITGAQEDLLYDWPEGQTQGRDHVMPDGSIYGLQYRQEEASGQNVLSAVYVAKPAKLSPAPVIVTSLQSGGGGSQLYYRVGFSIKGEWGEVLMAPDGSAIYVDAGALPPSATRHSIGTYSLYTPSGVVNFADRSSRLVSLDASTMKATVSTRLGDGGPLDIAMSVDFEIPKTHLAPDTTDQLLIMAPGVVTVGMIMPLFESFGDVTSMTQWIAVDDSTFGKQAQPYDLGLCPYPDQQGQFRAGVTAYPEPGSFLFITAKPDGSYIVDYQGKPDAPTPVDPMESFEQFQVLAGSRIRQPSAFWRNLVRSFESVED